MKIKFILEGPLQAWGVPSEYTFRSTSYHPTERGIVGLIGCCLGIPRTDSRLESLLYELKITYEIAKDSHGNLRSGSILTDFQTVRKPDGSNLDAAKGKPGSSTSLILHKSYINDASFIVHVEGPNDLMKRIYDAMMDPVWVPYLGRKSCTPTEPLIPEIESV